MARAADCYSLIHAKGCSPWPGAAVAKWSGEGMWAAAARVWALWTRLVQSLFGAWEWQAPPWSQWLARTLRERSRTDNRKLIDLATAVVDGHHLLP